MKSKSNALPRLLSFTLVLSTLTSGCIVRNGSSFYDLYTMFTVLWMLFLVLGLASGIYYIFGKDERKRSNSGKASVVCIILFVGLLITA